MTAMNGNRNKAGESGVYERYAAAAQLVEPAQCCPVEYTADFLSVIPDEIIERDYGCGDPTPYVSKGDTVLDLGWGSTITRRLSRSTDLLARRNGSRVFCGIDCFEL